MPDDQFKEEIDINNNKKKRRRTRERERERREIRWLMIFFKNKKGPAQESRFLLYIDSIQ